MMASTDVLSLPLRCSAALLAALLALAPPGGASADEAMAAKVEALVPALEAYVEKGMADFDDPGLAIGIVTGDRLVYAKGFGTRSKGGAAVDTGTLFQIGSTTKAFLAATMAIGVDREQFAWDDRVVDLYPDFRLKDPWVTREFRMFDIMAQRSGLPTYANDIYGMLGADEAEKIASLRHVDPTTSFRSAYTYTNITHLVAGRIVAGKAGEADWTAVLDKEILTPLGMTGSSWTMAAMEASSNHAEGHVWGASGSVEVPFNRFMPYDFVGAGAINSSVDDLQHWLRLLLADGMFDGERIVSAENLSVTRTPRVALTEGMSYAMGWIIQSTPNGTVTWHNGGTTGFGAYIGMAREQDVGVIVLTNQTNVGLPDSIGAWTLDRLLGNVETDYAAARLAAAKAADGVVADLFAPPASPRPAPALPDLAGIYTNDVFGAAQVAAADDGLVATLPVGAKLRLDHWDGEIFTIRLVPEGEMAAVAANFGPSPLGFAQFQIDASGRLAHLTVSFLMEGQAFVFTR